MESTRTLKAGTILNNKYLIETILGEGGFGITYRAKDTILNEIVAIKEYFPSMLGTRDTASISNNEITLIKESDKIAYEKGLQRFGEEAANLAKFNSEPGIVSVKNYFHENNTGYMVMEYIEGVTLKDYLYSRGDAISYKETLYMMHPIMASLSVIHNASIIHRDISPDNIMVTKNGTLKLIDFGAARYVGNEDEKSLTVMLKAGYAPPEQYQSNGHQGPWTDVYALCATMYRMISGQVPTESIERVMDGKDLTSVNKICTNIPESISNALDKGMAIDIKKRCQCIHELQLLLSKNNNKLVKRLIFGLVAAIMLLAAVLVIAASQLNDNKNKVNASNKTTNNTVTSEPSEEVNPTSSSNSDNDVNTDIITNTNEENSVLYTYTHAEIRTSPEKLDTNIIRNSDFAEEFEVLEYLDDGWIKVVNNGAEAFIEEKYLVSNEDLENWTKYYENVLQESDVPKKAFEFIGKEGNWYHGTVYDTDSLHGIFDDFDGDGDKELVIETAHYINEFIVDTSTNETMVSAEHILWFSNKDGVKKVDSAEKTIVADNYDWSTGFLLNADLWTSRFGKYLLVTFNDFQNRRYILDNGVPILIEERISSLGSTKNPINVLLDSSDPIFYSDDGKEYSGFYRGVSYYPCLYFNGELGQISSCYINESDISQLEGYDNIQDEIINRLDYPNYIDIGNNTQVYIDISEIKVDSVMYNDSGFFAINYIVYCKWRLDQFGNAPYDKYPPVNVGCQNDRIIGFSKHAIITFNNGELVYQGCHEGKHKIALDNYPVLAESDFNNFKGLDYYK